MSQEYIRERERERGGIVPQRESQAISVSPAVLIELSGGALF